MDISMHGKLELQFVRDVHCTKVVLGHEVITSRHPARACKGSRF
uniref:Uncharacterized protein n=1 Tax=Anguilla anguilla TaxID=7936 RepID=A0A0E9W388_ANGAN